MINQIQNFSKINRATLIRLEHPTSSEAVPSYVYYTDYARDIEFNGITFKSDVVKNIKNIKFTKELTAHKVKLQFTGLLEEQLGIVLEESASSFLNKTIKISQMFLDPRTEEVLLTEGEIVLFEGLISGSSLSDKRSGTNNTSSIEWDCANHFQDFLQVNGRITDDFTHRGMIVVNGQWAPSIATKRPEYAYDKGFYHANKSINVLAQYQTIENKFRMVKKRNWHGLSSSYSLQEYTEVVTKEVDIRFDLSAKFLPVVYGVQKVPAIPIFADTDKNDPSSVWVVYAICEGEIEGFYDLHFSDAPIICLGEEDKEQRICFGNKKGTGSTMNTSLNPAGSGSGEAASVHGEHYVYNDGQGDINIWTYHGKPNQEAAPILVSKAASNSFFFQESSGLGTAYWDNSFKLLDTAYIICNYKLNDIDGGRTDIPTLDVEVKGIKVKTYNNGSLTTTNKTSSNAAWQLLDYLTSYRYGMSIPLFDISLETFEDVANKFNIVDTSYEASWVPFWRYLGWDDTNPNNRAIMQTNVAFQTEETIFKNVGSLLDQTKCSLNKFSGKYILQVESDNPSSVSINLDTDAINDISVKDLTGTSKFNTVTASISDPGKGWQSNSITFYDAMFKFEDRGVEKKLNLSFPYITNYYTARSMVTRELKKSRFSRSVTFTLPYYYIGSVLPNYNIDVTYNRYSWLNKKFLVESIEILYNGNILVTAEEFPDSVFINSGHANVGESQNPSVDVKVLPVRELQYQSSNTVELGANINGTLSWLPSLSTDISYYSVYWDGAEQTVLVPKPSIGTPNTRVSYLVDNLPIGTYTFTVKAVSVTGSFSSPKSISVNIDPAKYLPDVTNFRVVNLEPGSTTSFINNFVQLSWDKIDSANPDIKYNLQILNENDTILRDIELLGTVDSFTYTLVLNKQDYLALNSSVGAFRTLRFQIKAKGSGNAVSLNWSKIL